MEAKILKLRRNRKKEISFSHFWLGRIFQKIGSDREKVEKFVCLLRAPFPFTILVVGAGALCRVCVLFVEVFPFFSPTIAFFVCELFAFYL